MPGLVLRKLADKSGGQAAKDADLPGAPPGTWPASTEGYNGTPMVIEGEPPDQFRPSQKLILKGLAEGWIEGEGHEVVVRPAGPAHSPWGATENARNPHVFHHFAKLTICGVEYEVVHQPDKYADYEAATDPSGIKKFKADDATPVTDSIYAAGATRVDWFYELRRVGA